MTTTSKKRISPQVSSEEHKAAMYQLALAVDARLGIVGPPTITTKELQARMIANGVRPEDKIFTSELLRMRYGDDYDQDKYMHQLDEQNKKE